jgi:hypothetical protein
MESEYVSEYAKVVEAVSRRVTDAATAEAAKWRELGETGTDSAEGRCRNTSDRRCLPSSGSRVTRGRGARPIEALALMALCGLMAMVPMAFGNF